LRSRLDLAEAMSVDDYRAALAKREAMRSRFRAVAAAGDAMTTLSSAGPAPLMEGNSGQGEPGITHTTGLPAFNAWTSAIGCPAVTVPMLAIGGMPVGVQVVGRPAEAWRPAGVARWPPDTLAPVAASSSPRRSATTSPSFGCWQRCRTTIG